MTQGSKSGHLLLYFRLQLLAYIYMDGEAGIKADQIQACVLFKLAALAGECWVAVCGPQLLSVSIKASSLSQIEQADQHVSMLPPCRITGGSKGFGLDVLNWTVWQLKLKFVYISSVSQSLLGRWARACTSSVRATGGSLVGPSHPSLCTIPLLDYLLGSVHYYKLVFGRTLVICL